MPFLKERVENWAEILKEMVSPGRDVSKVREAHFKALASKLGVRSYPHTKTVTFLSSLSKDQSGRSVDDIHTWRAGKLESVHNYIQWIFPTKTRSAYNRSAPLMSNEDILFIRESFLLQTRLRLNWLLMRTRLYKLDRVYDKKAERFFLQYVQGMSNPIFKANRYDHNFARFSRIIETLTLAGLGDLVEEILAFLLSDQVVYAASKPYWANSK